MDRSHIERQIYNEGYQSTDILPNRRLISRLLQKRNDWLEEKLRCATKKGFALDVGCGTGQTSIKIAQMGFHVIGIDISDKRINTAKEQSHHLDYKIDFIVGNVDNMAFRNECFDLIYCTAILHHLPNLDRIMKTFGRLLSEDGLLLITEPGLLNPFAFIRRKFFPTSVHTPDERPFVPARLKRLCEKHFQAVEYRTFYVTSLFALISEKIVGEKVGRLLLKVLLPVDSFLTRVPLIRELSWIINIYAHN
ncbi:class I SAM-dependent methyltransferase [bacterium]